MLSTSRRRVSAPRIAHRSARAGNWASQRRERREFLEAGTRVAAPTIARRRCRRQEGLIADVWPVVRGEVPARVRALTEPSGDARPIGRRNRGEQPLAARDPPGDEAEAVAHIEPLMAPGTQEVLVRDDNGAAGAEPRAEPAVESQAGRVVQDDGVGMHHRRLRQERQSQLRQSAGDRRIGRSSGEHFRCQGEHPEVDVRRKGANFRGNGTAGAAGKAGVDEKRHATLRPRLGGQGWHEVDDGGRIAREGHRPPPPPPAARSGTMVRSGERSPRSRGKLRRRHAGRCNMLNKRTRPAHRAHRVRRADRARLSNWCPWTARPANCRRCPPGWARNEKRCPRRWIPP